MTLSRATLRPGFTIGMVTNWRGQQFELVEVRPHRAAHDGVDTLVLVWHSHCLTCGADFVFTTSQRKLKYPVRRCPEHRQKPTVTHTVTSDTVTKLAV